MKTDFRSMECGHPQCRDRRKMGLVTTPAVHGVDRSRYCHPSLMVAHPFVMGSFNAPKV